MKLKFVSILGIATLAATLSACGGAVTTTTNTTNKTANAVNTVANTTANTTNTVVNTTTTTTTNTATNTNSTASAGSNEIKIDEAGIAMTVPKGMNFSKEGEDTIVKTEDGGVEVRFSVPKDGDYDKAVSAAAEELDSYLDNVKIEKNGTKADVNGMEGTSLSGTAKDSDGDDVNFDLTVIDAPKKPVLATIYAEKASMEKHAADLETFFKSVRKQ